MKRPPLVAGPHAPSGALGRRALLRWAGALTATATLPGATEACSKASSPAPFFSPDERSALAVLADVILPPDQDPGGSALGAVEYIEILLTALDVPTATPAIFAGGPYSGRQPFSNGNGGPSSMYPPDDFLEFLPLDRVSLAAWRLRLYGSAGVPGGGPNDALFGPVIGYRDQVKAAIASAISLSTAPLSTLSPTDAASVFGGLTSDQRSLLIELVLEAAFAPPEYGGNAGGAGWRMCNFEGDIQPLGYSIYDEAAGAYRERPDAPMSTANPGPDPVPLTADTISLLVTITNFEGGTVFP